MTHDALPLRPYQRGALDSAAADLYVPGTFNRVAIVLPTGAGKTVCFAHMAKEHIAERPGDQVMVLVHTDELVQQAVAKMHAVAPHLDIGIVKAERRDVRAQVIVASVQSLRTKAQRDRITDVGLVVVDECHHATAPTYRAILDHYGCMGTPRRAVVQSGPHSGARVINKAVPAVGFTATLARGDGGPLGEIWQRVAFSRDIAWMVRKRYLIVPRGRHVKVPDLDLSTVRVSGGDFQDGSLGVALAESLAPEVVAAAYLEHAAERSGIAFFPTVASAYVFADAFSAAGIKTEVVHGKLPRDERRAILARLEAGVTQVVCNCMVLTEGFDSPRVSCIVVGRPTRSKPLYVQMVGRGLRVDPSRPYEDQDCLILDVVGASVRHDLRSIADLSERAVQAHEGASLLELEDELDAKGLDDETDYYSGEVVAQDFDPLAARSSRTWGRTTAGNYFVPAGKDAYVFLYETAPGAFSVAWRTTSYRITRYVCCGPDAPAKQCMCGQRTARRGGLTGHAGMDLEMAMAWGEDLAVDMGADPFETFTKKAAPWRKKSASAAQRSYARTLGVRVPEEIKAGELSDRMNKVIASNAIDPLVAKAKGEAK